MERTRREFLTQVSAGLALGPVMGSLHASAEGAGIRVSACDWSLGVSGPAALDTARAIGLDGLEVSAGAPAETLQIASAEYRSQYKEKAAAVGVTISSVALGLLNDAPLAADPLGPAWLDQAIEAAHDLGAKVILLAFFGKGDLRSGDTLKASELDVVVGRLKEAAPKAAQAGVILGLENTLKAEDNLRILDRVGSDAVQVYYDVGNSTYSRYDVPAEIRQLGKRICQIHFKDGKYYLGEGRVAMKPIAEAMRAIDYRGWVVLETSVPSKDRDADFRKNAAYLRELLGGKA